MTVVAGTSLKDRVYFRRHLRGLLWQAYVVSYYASPHSLAQWSGLGFSKEDAERALRRRLARVDRRYKRKQHRESKPLDRGRD